MLEPWKNPAIWHAINVHLPIVLGVLGLPLICVLAITRGKSRGLRWGAFAFYGLVTASAWFTVQTGERAMSALPPTISAAASERIEFHEKLAVAIPLLTGITTGLLLLANIPRRRVRTVLTTLALVLSVITAVWIAVAAHSGGVAVYEHALGTVAITQAAPATRPASTTPSPSAQAVIPTPERAGIATVSYTAQIKPLLKTRCAECHAGNELKGNFDVSTIASILKGGKKAGAGFVAGRPDESSIVHYIEGKKKQPRMPKGAKPLSEGDIALIRQWIAAGALDDANAAPAAVAATDAKPAATAPVVEEQISPDWDPQVKFNAAESIAVRRYVRMQNLPPAPAVPATKPSQIAFNAVDKFILAKYPDSSSKPRVAAPATPATTTASTQPGVDRDLCDDTTFVRRAFLDLIGMIPTADESRRFIDDKDPAKRAKLVDALLARARDYAGNWVPFWEDALCSNGLHQGGVGTHGNYRQWIFESFNANKPYDTFVQELIDPTMPGHPPRYVLNDNHTRTVQSSSDTAQVFLGTAIKCASCHSHFLNDEWPQARAVAFAGFFTDKDMELIRCERTSGQFITTHFMFNLPAAPTSAPSDPNARLKQVAQLITDPTNPRFAKTIVNRLWRRYMGLGLFEPADDYREDTPPSHPALLDWLADDFIRHGYDVKRTIRLIMTSRTYQLRYDPALEDHFDVAKPKDPRYFRSPGLRRLTAEQLLDSITVAMGQRVPDSRAFQSDVSSPLTRALGKPPVRNEVSTQRPDDTAVVQALELLNGGEWHDRVYGGELVTNSSVQPNIDELVAGVYWSVFNRAPAEKEKAASVAFLKSAPPPATTKPVEVVWVEDALPAGAVPQGAWKFAGKPDAPVFSGNQSHSEVESTAVPAAPIQHLFTGTSFPVSPKDTLFTHVYLDPKTPPKEIMIQFLYNGDWVRASWGSNDIPFAPNHPAGALPKLGEWVRLEIPAEKIGITKPGVIGGIAFTQFAGGKAYWDKTGASKGAPIHDPATIGDMLWALMTSPEFQYIR